MFTSGGHTNVTVLECISASGYALPSVVIFKYKSLTPEIHGGEADETIYASSTLGSGLIWKFSVSGFIVNLLHNLPILQIHTNICYQIGRTNMDTDVHSRLHQLV